MTPAQAQVMGRISQMTRGEFTPDGWADWLTDDQRRLFAACQVNSHMDAALPGRNLMDLVAVLGLLLDVLARPSDRAVPEALLDEPAPETAPDDH
jgi:hypothetical protein